MTSIIESSKAGENCLATMELQSGSLRAYASVSLQISFVLGGINK